MKQQSSLLQDFSSSSKPVVAPTFNAKAVRNNPDLSAIVKLPSIDSSFSPSSSSSFSRGQGKSSFDASAKDSMSEFSPQFNRPMFVDAKLVRLNDQSALPDLPVPLPTANTSTKTNSNGKPAASGQTHWLSLPPVKNNTSYTDNYVNKPVVPLPVPLPGIGNTRSAFPPPPPVPVLGVQQNQKKNSNNNNGSTGNLLQNLSKIKVTTRSQAGNSSSGNPFGGRRTEEDELDDLL